MFSFAKPPKPTQFQSEMARAISDALHPITKRRRDLMEQRIRGCVAGGICMNHDVQLVRTERCDCEGLVVVSMGATFWTAVEHDDDTMMVSVFHGWSTGAKCKHGVPAPMLPVNGVCDTLKQRGQPLH